MRELTSHKVNGLNEALDIYVRDEPGAGNACHDYQIQCRPADANGDVRFQSVVFQNGPIQEAGVNGVSNEALLAIVEDRLAGFQSGKFATSENGCALSCVRCAMDVLHKRTKDRMARGVEGTNQQ